MYVPFVADRERWTIKNIFNRPDDRGCDVGITSFGSGNKQWYEEVAAYAHETQHEKIIRGLVMCIAVIFYNFQERAQYAIDALLSDKNETIYGGCYTVGMAYAATGSPKAISLLLHLAVSDVSNDVRRASVTNIGFGDQESQLHGQSQEEMAQRQRRREWRLQELERHQMELANDNSRDSFQQDRRVQYERAQGGGRGAQTTAQREGGEHGV